MAVSDPGRRDRCGRAGIPGNLNMLMHGTPQNGGSISCFSLHEFILSGGWKSAWISLCLACISRAVLQDNNPVIL